MPLKVAWGGKLRIFLDTSTWSIRQCDGETGIQSHSFSETTASTKPGGVDASDSKSPMLPRTAASTKSEGVDASDSMSPILPRTAASTKSEGVEATVSILSLLCLRPTQDSSHPRDPGNFLAAYPSTNPSFIERKHGSLNIFLPKETPDNWLSSQRQRRAHACLPFIFFTCNAPSKKNHTTLNKTTQNKKDGGVG